ncbi:beta-(1--_2)glucan export ATP-binding/permease protein NdvA [Terrihabitans soli]|uniref:Beta-(1-->2)glucan export ATP-binding/permease protein NdvA n=1 Tax=Terrihabitans soli TaxID=708113 RepID=A0A6S6QWT2_9HYPH|nr:beta-(1-->2)glucan export ATP-binding/permease protein NdvA [Terrihabitans soli]
MLQAYRKAFAWLFAERGLAVTLISFGLVIAALQVMEPVLFGWAIDAMTKNESSFPLILMWAAAGFGAFLFGLGVSLQADRLAHRRRLAAMAAYLEHVLLLPLSFHSEARSGVLMRIMTVGCDSMFLTWLSILREHFTSAVALLVIIPIALWLNWKLALLLIALMVVYVAVNALVIRRTSGGQARVEQYFSDISGRVGDLFGNISVLQSFLAVPNELADIRRSLSLLLETQYPVLNWWAILSVLTRAASSLSIVAIFAFGAYLRQTDGTSVGEIVSFVGFANMLIGRLDQITNFAMSLFYRGPQLIQFFEVMDEEKGPPEKPDALPLSLTGGHVAFEHVAFRYPNGEGGLADLSFEAKPGETVALVGPTGSGKSTTLALLQRAWDPQAGRILIDGQDIKEVTLASLRDAISVVFQDAGLFNRSITENIRMGRPGATQAEIESAAKMAEAHEFIAAKPEGYATLVGERGQGLSGGERQRVAIARALLKNAPILILDEATSALDVTTEARVQAALENLRAGRTTFVIAHRLSTVRAADRILVLQNGRVAEQGGFDELVKKGGLFTELVKAGGFEASAD